MSVVFGDPTASSTASTSASVVSIGGGFETRSESPDPRRSVRISREKPASRVRKRAMDGYIQAYSRFDRKPDTRSTSRGPSPTT
jgi:hypothetical protein